jgi:hypothetical protein
MAQRPIRVCVVASGGRALGVLGRCAHRESIQNKARFNLLLSPTRKYFQIGDKDDYVVLDGGRVIRRIMLLGR